MDRAPKGIVVRVVFVPEEPCRFVRITPEDKDSDKWNTLIATLMLEAGMVVSMPSPVHSPLIQKIFHFARGDPDVRDWARDQGLSKISVGQNYTRLFKKDALLLFQDS